MEKSKDGNVSSTDHISHGFSSSTGENRIYIRNPRDAEVSTVSSERVHFAQQTSIRSDLSSEMRQPYNGKRKDSHEYLNTMNATHNKLLKTDSSSSKESGEVVQLSSVDSTDPIHTSFHYKFDLNEEDIEGNVAISVVAKVGVPMGLPKKPLQFGGELGWKRNGVLSAFRPTSFKNTPERKRKTVTNTGFDLNLAPIMDSDEISNQPERFLLDLNYHSENDQIYHKPIASSFDLNNNSIIDGKKIYPSQHSENQQVHRRPPSYWVDLSSMRGYGHVQPNSLLMATPTAEQMQMHMVVPPGVYIGKINNLPPTFYLNNVNNQPANAIPQIPGPVLAAYPGPFHFLEGSQGMNSHSHAYTNIRPAFFPNGSIPLMENGSRGVNISNAEVMIPIPARNGMFETREKPGEQGASRISYRQMGSWN